MGGREGWKYAPAVGVQGPPGGGRVHVGRGGIDW